MGFFSNLFARKPLKVALYGGAFNPPTIAHINVIDHVRQFVDEVWILPAYTHYHDKRMLDFFERFSMCQIAFRHTMTDNAVKLKSYEYAFRSMSDGSVSDLMNNIKKTYKGHNIEFYFVIGQDNADNIHKWKNHETLIAENRFLVLPRIYDGVPPTHKWYLAKPHQFLDNMEETNISSTELRNIIHENKHDLHSLEVKTKACKIVSEEIWDYILKIGVYQ